jgi:hypothetical protein
VHGPTRDERQLEGMAVDGGVAQSDKTVDERVDEAGELWTKKKQSKNQKII